MEEVQAFEEKHAVTFPPDLREYFLRLNGVSEDPDLFCFWPINRLVSARSKPLNLVTSVAKLPEADRYFVFADYLIESHYYAIYLGNNPALHHWVILPDFPNHPMVAPSFSSFLELYLQDSPRIYGNA
jgi:SMI1 / KNR4 family (SUKH-1)